MSKSKAPQQQFPTLRNLDQDEIERENRIEEAEQEKPRPARITPFTELPFDEPTFQKALDDHAAEEWNNAPVSSNHRDGWISNRIDELELSRRELPGGASTKSSSAAIEPPIGHSPVPPSRTPETIREKILKNPHGSVSNAEAAEFFSVSVKTIRSWVNGEVEGKTLAKAAKRGRIQNSSIIRLDKTLGPSATSQS